MTEVVGAGLVLNMQTPIKILVVDDDVDTLRGTCRVLEQAGYELLTAGTGADAFEAVRRHRPQLVVLDRQLPDMDGLQVCQRIKSDASLVDTCVVMASAMRTIDEGQTSILESGADGYIVRPIGNRELLARIDAFVRVIHKGQSLREKAEIRLRQQPDLVTPKMSEDLPRLLHEYQVHQIELEIQNEELRRAQNELELSHGRYASLFNEAPVGYAILDSTGIIFQANSTLAELFDITRAELLNKPLSQFLHSEDRRTFLGRYRSFWDHPADKVIESRYYGTAKAVCWGEIRGRTERQRADNEAKQEEHLLITFSDITLRKRAEESLRDTENRRQQLEMQLRQAQKMESVGQLAGGIAHDFNNILAATMMRLSFLLDNNTLDQQTLESLKELMVEAERAANLTRQLLMFSRREIMKLVLVEFNGLLDKLLKMLRRLLVEDIEFVLQASPTPLWINADPGMIEMVVMNLWVNARDAMPGGGRLTLSANAAVVDSVHVERNPEARLGRFVCLSVTDNGCGMDRATMQHLFEPFFTTKEAGKGTGMGLAAVHGIVKQHQGWVEVESAVGQGSTFRVYLPQAAAPVTSDSEDDDLTFIGGKETILVVEDDSSVRSLTASFLRYHGYTVIEAGNGIEAEQLWEQFRDIDLLYTDMVMPEGVTGLELARKLRMKKSGLPVVISSGYSQESLNNAVKVGANITYLPKPCRPIVMAKTIRTILDHCGSPIC